MPLKQEFKYYLDNQAELAKKYEGKIIVIKDQKVIGVYTNDLVALRETSKSHKPGTFLVQRCSVDNSAHTATFHSRVRFA